MRPMLLPVAILAPVVALLAACGGGQQPEWVVWRVGAMCETRSTVAHYVSYPQGSARYPGGYWASDGDYGDDGTPPELHHGLCRAGNEEGSVFEYRGVHYRVDYTDHRFIEVLILDGPKNPVLLTFWVTQSCLDHLGLTIEDVSRAEESTNEALEALSGSSATAYGHQAKISMNDIQLCSFGGGPSVPDLSP